MDADSQSQEESQEQEEARVVVASPEEDEPHIQGAEEHRHAVDFAFDGGEPGGVAEEVAECADEGWDLGFEC